MSKFTCCAERYTKHCEEFGYKPCNVCADYELGLYEPHYPVPAIRIDCVIHPEGVYFWKKTIAGYIFLKEISSGRM